MEGTPIDREKIRSIGVISRRSGPLVREGHRSDGVRIKSTTDELGNTVTEHAVGDRQDVLINAPSVSVALTHKEVRDVAC